jgi:membrane-associated phospholipid phosphatase
VSGAAGGREHDAASRRLALGHDRAVTGGRRVRGPIAALVLALVLLTALVAAGALRGVDAAAQPWFTAQVRPALASRALGVLAALGEVRFAGAALLVTVLWACGRARSPRPALGTAVAVVGTALTVGVLKVAIGRTAPGAATSDVLAGGRSYPSGHAATASVCLLLMAYLVALDVRGRWRRGAVVVASVLSVVVAWATVALGFHWVSDVVGGLLVAAAWASGVRWWLAAPRTRSPVGGDTVGGATRPGR